MHFSRLRFITVETVDNTNLKCYSGQSTNIISDVSTWTKKSCFYVTNFLYSHDATCIQAHWPHMLVSSPQCELSVALDFCLMSLASFWHMSPVLSS